MNQQNQLALLLAHVNEEIRMADIQKVRDVMMSNFTKVDGIMKVPDALNMMRNKKLTRSWWSPGMKMTFTDHDLERYRQKSDWTKQTTS